MSKNVRATLLYAFILFLLACGVIFFQHDLIPKNIAYDEIELAKLAVSLDGKPYTPFSPMADGHGTLYFYIMLASFKLFGITKFAARLPAALCGVISILAFYFVLKMVFDKALTFSILKRKYNLELAFIGAVILSTLHWYINFVRFSFEMPFLLALELLSLLFTIAYTKNKNILFIILGGLFAGLAFNSYQPGRIFFVVPLVYLLLQKTNLKRLIIFSIFFVIAIAPMSIYLLSHNSNDIRVNQQFFLKNSSMSVQQKAAFLGENIKRVAFMFNIEGDINGRHNYPQKPALNPIIGILFIAGLALTLFRWKDKINAFFLTYFFIALLPTILTYPWENPNMLRTFTALPSIVFFVCNSFYILYTYVNKKVDKRYIIALIIFFVIVSAGYELRTYFKFQKEVFTQAFEYPDNLKTYVNKPEKFFHQP